MNPSLLNAYEPSDISALEYAPLGEGYVLHSRISGAILLSNAIGLTLYQHLQAGKNRHEIAQQMAGELELSEREADSLYVDITQSWKTAGLLDTHKPPFPNPVIYQPLRKPYDTFTLGYGQQFVTIKCADQMLTSHLLEALQHYQCEEPNETATIISISSIDDGFGIFVDQHPVWEQCNRDMARNLVLREVATILCGTTETGALLHAGCVANTTKNCLIITHKSGYGKSTLTAGLVAAGPDYLADDLLPLHKEGQSVISFPAPLALKQGAWNLAEAKSLGFEASAPEELPRKGVIYRNIPNSLPLGTRANVSAIIFPYFDKNNQNSLTRLSPETALHKLIEAGGRTNREHPSIRPMARLLNHAPAYALNYSSSGYSIQTCLELLT